MPLLLWLEMKALSLLVQIMDKGHGWGFIALLFVALFVASYFYAINKKSEDNTYKSGSVDNSKTTDRKPFSIDLLNFSCEFVKPDGTPLKRLPKP